MKKSFTLIEILVVTAITLIFLGVGLVQYNTYTEQAKLKSEGKKLVDVLELAKKKALSADLQDKNCSNFTGYKVTISSGSYLLSFGCDLIYTPVHNYILPTNITMTVVGAVGIDYLNFPPLMSGLNFAISSIKLQNSSITTANKCINISISEIGIIELNETLVAC